MSAFQIAEGGVHRHGASFVTAAHGTIAPHPHDKLYHLTDAQKTQLEKEFGVKLKPATKAPDVGQSDANLAGEKVALDNIEANRADANRIAADAEKLPVTTKTKRKRS